MDVKNERNFTLIAPHVKGQAQVWQLFDGNKCAGMNVSPMLSWKDAPPETCSFAVTMYDRDAPSGSGWWHWIVYNISSMVSGLPENAGNPQLNLLPEGASQGLNDFGLHGYSGPCPPKGDGIHEYMITVYALSVSHIDLQTDSTPASIGFQIHANTIEKASVVMYYSR
ncbi:YbhB/YbcL family Raf kinase inhibitor-like protein [Coprobacter tertius]|uniref:YbhB/YbcL family Raf kinase inhibitor-like protein n=1 Tax=Coprobacter tertius TaxID=2944915 RepID=A0ABT1MJV3_9BACT|nr:YbhB/YbcL family Raf kinase inhibitor-like protein [Coprobacter tertius]MCP9612919.1 YbhB/YbcL family Raf kinase inhibitor-like protein [Coprobacter tertius]